MKYVANNFSDNEITRIINKDEKILSGREERRARRKSK